MPSPFPGMDPYLEHPAFWPSVHGLLISGFVEVLSHRLRPRYYLSIEERFYLVQVNTSELVGVADVLVSSEGSQGSGANGRQGANGWDREGTRKRATPGVLTVELPQITQVRQRFLEVRTPGSEEVVTIIEVLSPVNKRAGDGRRQYESKRIEIANTLVNLVELDLLRDDEPLPVLREGGGLVAVEELGDYRMLVSRGAERPRADLYAITVRELLPRLPIPLRPGEEEPEVDVRALIDLVYERGSYDMRIDYHAEPVPALGPDDATWADALLREQGLR